MPSSARSRSGFSLRREWSSSVACSRAQTPRHFGTREPTRSSSGSTSSCSRSGSSAPVFCGETDFLLAVGDRALPVKVELEVWTRRRGFARIPERDPGSVSIRAFRFSAVSARSVEKGRS